MSKGVCFTENLVSHIYRYYLGVWWEFKHLCMDFVINIVLGGHAVLQRGIQSWRWISAGWQDRKPLSGWVYRFILSLTVIHPPSLWWQPPPNSLPDPRRSTSQQKVSVAMQSIWADANNAVVQLFFASRASRKEGSVPEELGSFSSDNEAEATLLKASIPQTSLIPLASMSLQCCVLSWTLQWVLGKTFTLMYSSDFHTEPFPNIPHVTLISRILRMGKGGWDPEGWLQSRRHAVQWQSRWDRGLI